MKFFNWSKPSEFAIVGKDIKWNQFQREVCRVINFDRNDTIIDSNGKVISKSIIKPYGFLITEWPVIERKVKIPIVHGDDFLLASSVFDNGDFLKEVEDHDILVTYYPLDKKVGKNSLFFHKLHFVVTPPHTLEKYYELRNKSLLGCYPEILFGDFAWMGELKVKMNLNPNLD